ncbi:MAG: HEAT repeat domain-containing protein [Desulforhabdus sp.]|jgi:hypothetical protein|nr:HEAT repeat domain-containing protein [Desulforhabdus sp.]
MNLEEILITPAWEWTEETGKYLKTVLTDGSAKISDRILAAELSAELSVMNDEIAETLLAIVEDREQSEELRGSAVTSLGPAMEYVDTMEFEDEEEEFISEPMFSKIRQSLRQLYDDAGTTEELRRQVLEASVHAPEEWHSKAVRAAYYSEDEDWQITAVFCMNFIRGFDVEILESLRNTDPDIHIEAVSAAGAWGLDAAWEHVATLASDEDADKDLRLTAIDALAAIRPSDSLALLGNLTTSEDEDIVEAAYEALAIAEGAAGMEDWDEEE